MIDPVLAKLKNIDIPIVVILFAFMVISTMMVYSASIDHPTINISITKILVLYALGLVAFVACSLFDYRVLIQNCSLSLWYRDCFVGCCLFFW